MSCSDHCALPLDVSSSSDGKDHEHHFDGQELDLVQDPTTMWRRLVTSASLDHRGPRDFLVSPWDGGDGSRSRTCYAAYRSASALYFTAWLLLSWSGFWDRSKWFIYLTHWALILLVVDLAAQALILLLNGTHGMHQTTRITVTFKALWVVGNVSAAMALAVTLGFWIFLYDGSQPLSAVTVHTHGVNAAFVLVDTLVSARPCRLAHAFHAVIAAVVYVAFTCIYWLLGGSGKDGAPYVYPVLNWDNGPKTFGAAFCLAILGAAAMHLPRWVGTMFRDAMFPLGKRKATAFIQV